MRLISLLIHLMISCCGCWSSAATLKCDKMNGVAARTLRFPRQITSSSLQYEQAKARFVTPRHLQVTLGQARIVGNQIELSALLQNRSRQPFSLVVHPYGGSFPYGGDSPFQLKFSRSVGEVIKYSGKLYPPEPPLPMVLQIPARSCVQFEATIDLGNYTYKGSPKVSLDWAFYYFAGKYPQGKVEIQLPKK